MGVLRSEPRRRTENKALTPLQVGEIWWAQLPGDTQLTRVTVEEITECTVVLNSSEWDDFKRFARVRVDFIERATP